MPGAFLFPFRGSGVLVLIVGAILLGVLTVGFVYEWKKGALEWD